MSKFDECIDPKFNFSFSNPSENNITNSKKREDCSTNSFNNKRLKHNYSHSESGDQGFNDYLAKKLAEMLEQSIKHVDCAAEQEITSHNGNDGIQLFTDSEIMNTEIEASEIPFKRRKKKNKEKVSRESKKAQFDEAAVSADWVIKQSIFYNS